MELAPLGIKVTLVVAGGIRSKFGQRQLESLVLPDGKSWGRYCSELARFSQRFFRFTVQVGLEADYGTR
jgi:hypothetical protein